MVSLWQALMPLVGANNFYALHIIWCPISVIVHQTIVLFCFLRNQSCFWSQVLYHWSTVQRTPKQRSRSKVCCKDGCVSRKNTTCKQLQPAVATARSLPHSTTHKKFVTEQVLLQCGLGCKSATNRVLTVGHMSLQKHLLMQNCNASTTHIRFV